MPEQVISPADFKPRLRIGLPFRAHMAGSRLLWLRAATRMPKPAPLLCADEQLRCQEKRLFSGRKNPAVS